MPKPKKQLKIYLTFSFIREPTERLAEQLSHAYVFLGMEARVSPRGRVTGAKMKTLGC